MVVVSVSALKTSLLTVNDQILLKREEIMEPAGGIMEGGEWSSFNEEADFMAQLFPTTHSSLANNNVVDGNSGLACWSSNDLNMPNSNLYSSFSQDSYSGGSCVSNYYLSHNFLGANNDSAVLVEFHEDRVEGKEMEECGKVEHSDTKHLFPTRELEDKDNDYLDIPSKRARASDGMKGKRNASKSKKRRKACSVEDDSNGGLIRQSSSGCSSEDESNLSLELNYGASSSGARNLNGKTRASRGSATDPQSLYARKRRERINERLRVLQNLVPNGTKVDISTMLEEAVQYVKFLQLQIKLLSSDDLWMYAPLAYNGMDIGLNLKLNALN